VVCVSFTVDFYSQKHCSCYYSRVFCYSSVFPTYLVLRCIDVPRMIVFPYDSIIDVANSKNKFLITLKKKKVILVMGICTNYNLV
jgi:hypothetical protein